MVARETRRGTRKPAGGYILVRAGELLGVWAALRAKFIRLVDLRVWFACHELVARRSGARKGVTPRYQPAEVHRLVGGVRGKRLEASIRRLEGAGLLRWSTEMIEFPSTKTADMEAESVSLARLVPVPRRLVRYIAGGTTRVMTATILGHLLRCVFYHRGLCTSEGACKASWVAATFGVDERNVKKARARLVELGWLRPVDAAQWRKNRWGGVFRVDLSWSGTVAGARTLPPPRDLSTTQTPPPVSDKHPLREYNNQKPAERGPVGVQRRGVRDEVPSLNSITPEDLGETARLLRLHTQAHSRGLADAGEAGRLRFVALAAHARRYATRNAPGLFAWLLREGKWGFITQKDEDLARAQLSRVSREERPRRQQAPMVLDNAKNVLAAVLGRLGEGRASRSRLSSRTADSKEDANAGSKGVPRSRRRSFRLAPQPMKSSEERECGRPEASQNTLTAPDCSTT